MKITEEVVNDVTDQIFSIVSDIDWASLEGPHVETIEKPVQIAIELLVSEFNGMPYIRIEHKGKGKPCAVFKVYRGRKTIEHGVRDILGLPEADASKKTDTIFTHDIAAGIVESFENVLDQADITVPSPEDDEKDADNTARLYGSVYSNLLDVVEDVLIDVLGRKTKGAKVVPYAFSGTM